MGRGDLRNRNRGLPHCCYWGASLKSEQGYVRFISACLKSQNDWTGPS